jgi:hypothetical protein
MIVARGSYGLPLFPLALAIAGCAVSTQALPSAAPHALEGHWLHVEEDGMASIESLLSFDAAHRFESAMTVRYRDDGAIRPGCITRRADTGPTWSADAFTFATAGTNTWTVETTGCKEQAHDEARTVRSAPVEVEARHPFTIEGDELTLRYDFDRRPVLLQFERL